MRLFIRNVLCERNFALYPPGAKGSINPWHLECVVLHDATSNTRHGTGKFARQQWDCTHKSRVISKETVGNTWDSLNAILGQKYLRNHSSSFSVFLVCFFGFNSSRLISCELSYILQQTVSVCYIVICVFQYAHGRYVGSVVLLTSAPRTRARRQKLDPGQTSKEHVHTERENSLWENSLFVENVGFSG